MNPEELLKTLKDGGLEDKAIKDLLEGTLALLNGKEDGEKEKEALKDEKDEKDEKAEASRLLGVEL